MNFREYFNKFSIKNNGSYSNSDYEYAAEKSWDACKQEVLKIIKDKKERKSGGVLVDEVIEDIENL